MRYTISYFLLVALTACEPKAGTGERMPEFDLMLPDGKVFNTSEIPKGSPIVMIYYDGMCDDCHEEISAIKSRIADFKNVKFYLVSLEPLDQLVRFKNYLKLDTFKNIIVARDTAKFFPAYVKARSTPYIVLYDKDKMMKGALKGKAPIDTLIKYVQL